MKSIAKWKFIKKNIPWAERYKPKNNLPVFHISPIQEGIVWDDWRNAETCLVCGDGSTLLGDVKRFETWGIPHDVYAVNRSMLAFQRPITHWAAIDAEESLWFSQNLVHWHVPKGGRILRHTIGSCPVGYDVGWKVDQAFENETQKHMWAGNSGYFGVLSAIKMGYRKVVLAGMPLDIKPHWYEHKDQPGPNWTGQTYRTWIDFKTNHETSDMVRSMSGYSAFIFGEASKQWAMS